MNTADLVRSLISLKGKTALEIAQKTAISPSTLSRYLRSKTDLKAESLVKILAELNIDCHRILKSSLIGSSNDTVVTEAIRCDLNFVFDSLDEMDQKTVLNLLNNCLDTSSSQELKLASKRLAQYASGLGLRRRYA